MLFTHPTFLFYFLPLTLGVYALLIKNRNAQNVWLLAVSLVFYAWGEPWFVLMMGLSILVNWFCALRIDHTTTTKHRKAWLMLSLVFNLGVLFIFKYLNYSVAIASQIFKQPSWVTQLVLPIGISFFTFQALSYVIDVYRKTTAVQPSLLRVGLYIALFPQLIAGPIVRYSTIAHEIEHRTESWDLVDQGLRRFVVGLGKKILLANTFAIIADAAFAMNRINTLTQPLAWLGIIAYTLQIYFDFSGYSDMAIGLGKVFGFHFLENFNLPYTARSVTDFWRRWHISLSTWFRDYVYFPLGGSQVASQQRLILNLLIVWFLTGIWHGANLTFMLWGLWFFVWITIEKLTGLSQYLGRFGHVSTLLIVMMGWVGFRAESLALMLRYFKSLLTPSYVNSPQFGLLLNEYGLFLIAGILIALGLPQALWTTLSRRSPSPLLTGIALVALVLLAFVFIIKGSYNPFIYFNF
jgi:alginate O-acetyltransferase complex protein AlgI